MVRSLAALGLSLPALATAFQFEGVAELEGRYFYNQSETPGTGSVALAPRFLWDAESGRHRVEGQLFQRLDATDRSRTHGDVRELYYQFTEARWEMSLGARQIYWGVTESRQLVDILNQADFVEDLAAEEMLGQPMLTLGLRPDFGAVDLFLLPYQRARTWPGVKGHPRIPFPVDAANARYEHRRGQRHLDRAGRLRLRFGALDVNLNVFDGTARDPDLLPCLRQGSDFEGTEDGPNCDIPSGFSEPNQPLPPLLFNLFQSLGLLPSDEALQEQFIAEQTPRVLANLVLVPQYDRLRQVGVDAQFITGGWALKLEALVREQGGERSHAAVGGFEYTLPRFFETGWDVGLLAEYLYDERTTVINNRFDNDVFLATRIGFNDIAGSQLLAGFFFDRRGDDHLLQLEASRRLGADWRATLTWRHFDRVPGDALTGFLDDEDMLRLTLERYF